LAFHDFCCINLQFALLDQMQPRGFKRLWADGQFPLPQTLQLLSGNSERLLDERKVLTEWLALRINHSPYLFPSRNKQGSLSRVQVYRLFRSYCALAGVPDAKRGFHALKHTLGRRMADGGCDVKDMRLALGHKSLSSTVHYFEVTTEQADRARQVALMSRV